MPQDMPPVGGYRPVQYKRNLPARGFRPVYYLLGVGAIMTYGIHVYGKGIDEYKYVEGLALDLGTTADILFLSELCREKMWARIHLLPLLQAEEDRDQVRRYLADQDREKQLLGKTTKLYHSDR
jgi:hypothetical protein